jgi:hypothetical protein
MMDLGLFYDCRPATIVESFSTVKAFYGVGSVNPTPNPPPGGPGCPSLSVSLPLTCSAWETLPAATLSGSYDVKVGIHTGG